MSAVTPARQLQQIFNHAAIEQCNSYSRHIFKQLHQCNTAAMGMHHYRCSDRHCPGCGGLKKEQWIENLTAQLFPTGYYHVVFTLPHEFNALMLGNRTALFKLLFQSASAALLQFATDPQYLGAVCGITAVLHTWGQDLSFHPHVH
jgi:hypothetical protein